MKLSTQPRTGKIRENYHFFAIKYNKDSEQIRLVSCTDVGDEKCGQFLRPEDVKELSTLLYEWYLYLSKEEF